MRISKSPVRFHDPVYIVRPRRITLMRFEGQPAIYDTPRRLPWLSVQKSGISQAGFGLFLREGVKAGDTITTYRTKIISEREAKKLKNKVSIPPLFHFLNQLFVCAMLLSRATNIFVQTTLLVSAWTPSRMHRKTSRLCAPGTRLVVLPTLPQHQMQYLWTSDSILSWKRNVIFREGPRSLPSTTYKCSPAHAAFLCERAQRLISLNVLQIF